jgi:hypothetical protein
LRGGSEGVVSSQRLAAVPILRPGEALEMVPGLIVTQHAGDGKANQYFLRGFNLDHGTDFATYVGGVPVNMPSHAHGQGYTDLNFLIPELVDRISFRKGPYYADEGDFSSAGAAHIDYFRKSMALAQVTAGQNGIRRSLLAGSPVVGPAICFTVWSCSTTTARGRCRELPKLNGVLRYSQGRERRLFGDRHGLSGAGPRPIRSPSGRSTAGYIDRFGTLDPTTGGETYRYSLSGDWAQAWQGQPEQGQRLVAALRSRPVVQLPVLPERFCRQRQLRYRRPVQAVRTAPGRRLCRSQSFVRSLGRLRG